MSNKDLVKQHYAAFWSGDEAALRAQLAEDFTDHGTPDVLVGIEPVLAHMQRSRAAFPDMTVTFKSMVEEGDRVAVHAEWRGTHKGPYLGIASTGKSVAFEGMVFWRIAGGRIAERWAMVEAASLVQQLKK